MNILCVEQFSNWGGGQRSLIDLLPAFFARGWRPHVAVPDEGPFAEAVRRLGYRTETLKCNEYASIRKPPREIGRYARELPRLARSIDDLVQALKVDLIYVNGGRLLPPAAWVARWKAIPLVFHCHSRLLQSSAVFLAGESLRFSRAQMIASCQYAAEPLRTYVDPYRLSVIYNGVAGTFRASHRVPGRPPRIGVIGRIEPEKGQLEFVRAAKLVANQLPECRFTVIGAPMFTGADYYNRVVAAAVGSPIEFCGWQEDVSQVYSTFDLLVVPSTRLEATTRVILEAYSAGVPVVAFPAGGIPEILKDGETGFLAEGSTARALAERILSVLRMHPTEINSVVVKAGRAWQEHYTLDRYRQQICDVLARCRRPLPLEAPQCKRQPESPGVPIDTASACFDSTAE
ncbi:MAG TPA: glycosyltransferase family 4 protein [Terriglobales bacterium]